jgi:hypothetical protein
MAEQSADPLADILRGAKLSDPQRAGLWDVYQASKNEDDLSERLKSLSGIPDDLKASLWDLKAKSAVSPATKEPQAAEWTRTHPNIAGIARSAINTLPAIGGGAAGVLFAPEEVASGGLGAIPAVALGVGVGRGLRDLIAEATGLDAPSSPASKAGRIVLDTGEAAAMQAVVPGLVEAIKTPGITVGEILDMFPFKIGRRIRAMMPQGLEKAPAAILDRPSWQTLAQPAKAADTAVPPEAMTTGTKWGWLDIAQQKQNFQSLKDATEKVAETAPKASAVPKLTADESAFGLKMMRGGMKAEDALQAILERRRLPASWRLMPSDEEVKVIVDAANKAGRMVR